MTRSNEDSWKNPLGYYEKAINELTKTRTEIQLDFQNLKSELQLTHQEELETLKVELHATKERLATLEKFLAERLNSPPVPEAQINSLRIEHGVWEGNARDTPGWSILEGEGKRIFKTYICFQQDFSAPPKVLVAISYFDIIKTANSRLNVKVAEVDHHGFYCDLHTWRDTKVWATGVSWLAYGY